jgi:hypothetical protein
MSTAAAGAEHGYEPALPLVTLASRGGPHDDDAYTAGWEMGALDAELTHRTPFLLEQLIRTVNREQADLIGMKHGYLVDIIPVDHEWSSLRLTRSEERP